MENNEQKPVHSFYYKNNLKKTMGFIKKQQQNKNNQG